MNAVFLLEIFVILNTLAIVFLFYKFYAKRSNYVKMLVIPGGKMPERKTGGAVCFDVFLRAIVSPTEMEDFISSKPPLRKTLFDFKNMPSDPAIRSHIFEINGKLVYRIYPGESALVGIGFMTEMEFPMSYKVLSRSGLCTRSGITVANALCPIDSNYRGEAGALIKNQNSDGKPFDLEQNMRIAQVEFTAGVIPEILPIKDYSELSRTGRGAGGFSSTGLQ